MHRARNFWRHGLRLSQDKNEVDAWLGIVSSPSFSLLANRTAVYPAESIVSYALKEKSHTQKLGSGDGNGFTLFNAIARVGGEDREYLVSMAKTMHNLAMLNEEASIEAGLNPAIPEIARGFAIRGRAVLIAHGGQVHVGSEQLESPDTNLVALAREVANLRDTTKRTITPSAALAKLEFVTAAPQSKPFFENLRGVIRSALEEEDLEKRRRESMDFVRGSSRLLLSAFGFAASSEGVGSENAAKMYRYLVETNGQHGRQTTPSRKSLIILANQITPLLKEALGRNDLHNLSPEVIFDTYFALDRLFAFVEYEARRSGKTEASEIIKAVLSETIAKPRFSQDPVASFKT